MLRSLFFILLLSAVSLLISNHSALGADEGAKPSIRLQKWQFHKDRSGAGHLVLRFGNYGDNSVNLNEISIDKGCWLTLGVAIDAGKTATWSCNVSDPPAYVEIATSQGRFHLDLDPENESR